MAAPQSVITQRSCTFSLSPPLSVLTCWLIWIFYFLVYSFEDSVGLPRHLALLMSGFLQIWFLVASFGTWYGIEKVGRRKSFMFSATSMAIVMAILAASLAVDTHATGIVAAIMVFLYQSFYTWGFMGGIWVGRSLFFSLVLPFDTLSIGLIPSNSVMDRRFFLSLIAQKALVSQQPVCGFPPLSSLSLFQLP